MTAAGPSEFARRAFGCGIGYEELKQALDALDTNLATDLERVAWRMCVTLTLRYRLSVVHVAPPLEGEEWRMSDEFDALELYLLFTCLDTLASGARFKHFQDWLRALPAGATHSRDEMINLFNTWQSKHGATRNLKRLFVEGLPSVLVDWLLQSVRIVPEDAEPTHDALPWEIPNDPSELRELLFRYFNELRRVPYTHRSQPRPYTGATDIVPHPPKGESWTFGRESGFRFPGAAKRYQIVYHEGVDEATILRMIVIAVAVEKLGFIFSEDQLNKHLANLSRIHALHGLLLDMRTNNRAVQSWHTATDKGCDLVWSAMFRGIPYLHLGWAPRVLDRLRDNPLERGVHQKLESYGEQIRKLNAVIESFNISELPLNKRYPPGGKEKLTSEEAQDREKAVIGAYRDLSLMTEARVVAEALSSQLVERIGLMLRDPCYT